MSINYHFTPLFALCGAPPIALLPQMGTRHLDHGFGANYLHNIPLTKTLFQIGMRLKKSVHMSQVIFVLLEGASTARHISKKFDSLQKRPFHM